MKKDTFIDVTGQRFGKLVAISREIRIITNKTRSFWLCRCDCGNITKVIVSALIRKTTKSCGCGQAHITHGESKSQEYQSWRSAKSRCYSVNHVGYKNYGGRGVIMCDRWKDSFENFLADMGKCPENYTLERKDVNGNYEPNNCIWATRRTQSNNRRNNVKVTHNNETKTLAEWARVLGLHKNTVINRYKRGTLFTDAV